MYEHSTIISPQSMNIRMATFGKIAEKGMAICQLSVRFNDNL